MDYDKLLDTLLEQLKNYSSVHRKSTQPFTKEKVIQCFKDYSPDFQDKVIRESLIEHVGCLPIIATYLYPYMDKEVNLGKALTMLAIHDIGETVVGDELTFNKSNEQDEEELNAAIKILHDSYQPLYSEFNQLKTNEALFAKSIDKMAPDIYDYLCGEEYSINRMVVQAGWNKEEVIQNVRKKKRPFMEWSPFLTKFHDTLFQRFETCK